jgi:hypothetical protein
MEGTSGPRRGCWGLTRYLTVEASARQRYLSGLTSVFGSHDAPNLVGKALKSPNFMFNRGALPLSFVVDG